MRNVAEAKSVQAKRQSVVSTKTILNWEVLRDFLTLLFRESTSSEPFIYRLNILYMTATW